jgi:diguanylate cyclase (GGDEF)-like protein/PAS domain S-box-containing protein
MHRADEARLDDDALRVWRRVLDIRTALLSVAALQALLFPAIPSQRWTVAPVMVLGVVPYSIALSVRVRRRRQLDRSMPFTDILIAAGFAFTFPEAWPAVTSVCAADIGLAVVTFGRRMAVIAAAVGVVALSIAALQVPDTGGAGVTGFFVAAALMIWTVGFVAANERALRKRHSDLVNGVDGIVWEWDRAQWKVTFMSRQVESILGWSLAEAMLAETWNARTHPDDEATATERLSNAIEYGDTTAEFRVRHADGHWVWVRDALTVERDADGAVRQVRGVIFDVTREHEAALALQQYADIVEHIQFSLIVWRLADPDDDQSVVAVRVNPAAEAMFGKAAADTIGRRLVDLWPTEQTPAFAATIADTIRRNEPALLDEVPFPGQDGERWMSVRMIPLPDSCAALVTEDVTERRNNELALRHQAMHDSLTDLPNRALLQDRLVNALAVARRTRQPVALLILDLDQFKEVNDTLGHPIGDLMLEQVGHRLARVLRDCDTVARLGGDEFAVLLTVDASRDAAERVALRIQATLSEPFDLLGMSVQAAASIGVVLSPEHGSDAGTLVQRADIAMYTAKRSGRGFAFYAAEDDRSSVRRLALFGELRTALERDELLLHYQPQIDIATGLVVGVEALVRWQHPEHGLLLPNDFIELAEVSGMIQPLTRWVVRHAVAQAAVFERQGYPLVVGVNVSARNLYDPDLVTGIAGDLMRADVPPERLLLELTESELVDDPSQVMTVLSLVSGMGVRLAIDDFGTGWSSLANLTRLPIDQIKIDQSFVSHMLDGGDDAVIVRSIVDLGHNLGLAVIAEGVETESVLHELAELGCDQAQGFFIGRPMPGDDLIAWLASREAVSLPS